jgi:large subunit ribosomal protein L29
MRADEIRELSVDDINARVAELEEERFRLRFRSATETLENPLRLRTIRKDIARLKTVLGERQRGEQTEQGKQGERPKNG